MDWLQRFLTRVEERSAKVGVVGMGYVGLPLSLLFAESGFSVLGFDIDPAKVEALTAGQSYIAHIPSEQIQGVLDRGLFQATTDFEQSREADALLICVPTPLNRHREPDLSFVTGTMETLAPHLRPGHLVSLESTTYPGTTEEELKPRLDDLGFTVGSDIFLVYSPERGRPGKSDPQDQKHPQGVRGSHAVLPAGREGPVRRGHG